MWGLVRGAFLVAGSHGDSRCMNSTGALPIGTCKCQQNNAAELDSSAASLFTPVLLLLLLPLLMAACRRPVQP
jgi:hypothetical protein